MDEVSADRPLRPKKALPITLNFGLAWQKTSVSNEMKLSVLTGLKKNS